MGTDLSFVVTQPHRQLLEQILGEARGDEEITGLMLIGSVARGDAYPDSDLDLCVLLRNDCTRAFRSEPRGVTQVEWRYVNWDQAHERLAARPMEVYVYLDGRILHDPGGQFEAIAGHARDRYETYRVPAKEKRYLLHCLRSVKIKLRAAMEAGDLFKAAYAAASGAWFILEAIWAVNEKPMPPAGALLAHFRKLATKPPHDQTWLCCFFAGDAQSRIQAAVEAIDWALPLLAGDSHAGDRLG
jgi:hypothetical protein